MALDKRYDYSIKWKLLHIKILVTKKNNIMTYEILAKHNITNNAENMVDYFTASSL